jgi:hypothetical protein
MLELEEKEPTLGASDGEGGTQLPNYDISHFNTGPARREGSVERIGHRGLGFA